MQRMATNSDSGYASKSEVNA
ncbi:MAG: hypothetical protein ACD_6C00775G0001, partial [uncultured bacterium]